MKAIHLIVGFLLFAALIAGGLFLLATAFQGDEPWTLLVDSLQERRIEAILITIVALFGVLLYALTSFRLPEKDQYLAYDVEGGTVSISLAAVQNFVARIADEFASVGKLEPTLKAKNGAIDVTLDVVIKSGSQIPELCKMLQDRTRQIIREKVGVSEVSDVRVRVKEITGGTAQETTSGEARPESFT